MNQLQAAAASSLQSQPTTGNNHQEEHPPSEKGFSRREAAEREFEELCALFTEDTLPMLSGNYFEDINELSVIDKRTYVKYFILTRKFCWLPVLFDI